MFSPTFVWRLTSFSFATNKMNQISLEYLISSILSYYGISEVFGKFWIITLKKWRCLFPQTKILLKQTILIMHKNFNRSYLSLNAWRVKSLMMECSTCLDLARPREAPTATRPSCWWRTVSPTSSRPYFRFAAFLFSVPEKSKFWWKIGWNRYKGEE